ncbi:cobalamin biosynthesis protein [Archaeoglobus veneficus]|uniref:cobalamin biosynthesis protein n=1 Tax=Archaeoglobus veneficus TaxID=58290 RepID=UPI002FBD91D6
MAVIGFGKDIRALRRLADWLRADIILYKPGIWGSLLDYDCIVAYMPTGIVIRGMCPWLRSKWVDPAVVVVDKAMRFAIPLLGGHHGGNEVAKMLENYGLTAVITTAMEYSEGLSVGIGCRRGISAEDVLYAIKAALAELGATLDDVRVIATVELKKDEEGLIEAVDIIKKPLVFVPAEDVNEIEVVSPSRAEDIGLRSVAEACALYCSKEKQLIFPKRVYGGVTIAIAR